MSEGTPEQVRALHRSLCRVLITRILRLVTDGLRDGGVAPTALEVTRVRGKVRVEVTLHARGTEGADTVRRIVESLAGQIGGRPNLVIICDPVGARAGATGAAPALGASRSA